jgi:hypothetical protein
VSDFDSWKAQATPYSRDVEVCADGDLVARLEDLERQREERSRGMLEAPTDLDEQIQALAEEVQSKTLKLTFRSIGRLRWRKLISEHPPTVEQKEQDEGLDHNPETFPPVAFSASCDALTEEQARWLCDNLPEGEFFRLWGACLAANLIGGDAKKAVATAAAARSEKK